MLSTDDPCCSKRKYDFVEEEEKENDETDQKRARSIDSDDAVAIAAAYAEDDEMQDYDDEIRNMLLEADFDEDDASSWGIVFALFLRNNSLRFLPDLYFLLCTELNFMFVAVLRRVSVVYRYYNGVLY